MPRTKAYSIRRSRDHAVEKIVPFMISRKSVHSNVIRVLRALADCPMFQKLMPPMPENMTLEEEMYVRGCRRLVVFSDKDAYDAGILVPGVENAMYPSSIRQRAYMYAQDVAGMMQPTWSTVHEEVINMITTLPCCCDCQNKNTSRECKRSIDELRNVDEERNPGEQLMAHEALDPISEVSFDDLFDFDMVFEHEYLDDTPPRL